MNDYKKQAKDFCKKFNVKIEFKLSGKYNVWGSYRNVYNVKITSPISGCHEWFKFNDSIKNTQKNIEPCEYDILSCLTKRSPMDFEDFCKEYGYESFCENCEDENRKSRQIYEDVLDEYEKVKGLFLDGEEMEKEFLEIN